jgi:hypothetical protein
VPPNNIIEAGSTPRAPLPGGHGCHTLFAYNGWLGEPPIEVIFLDMRLRIPQPKASYDFPLFWIYIHHVVKRDCIRTVIAVLGCLFLLKHSKQSEIKRLRVAVKLSNRCLEWNPLRTPNPTVMISGCGLRSRRKFRWLLGHCPASLPGNPPRFGRRGSHSWWRFGFFGCLDRVELSNTVHLFFDRNSRRTVLRHTAYQCSPYSISR